MKVVSYNRWSLNAGSIRADFRRGDVSEQWFLIALDCLIQVVSNTGLTVLPNIAEYLSWMDSVHYLRTRSRWFDPRARPIFFPRIGDSHCDRIHSRLISDHCFGNGYVGKQPVAWIGWLVVSGFNATLTAKVISWRSVTHMCFLAFSHQY